MKSLVKLAVLIACLAVSSQPLPAQAWYCSYACCTGDANFATPCTYYSSNYGGIVDSTCYWWWMEGGYCIQG